MAKAPTKKAKAKKGFEDTLWDTANQLRGSAESSGVQARGAEPRVPQIY